MKILIVRTFPNEIDINSYNVQEIGLAKALTRKGHQCDIVLYTNHEEKEEQLNVEGSTITIYWMKGVNFFKNLLWSSKLIKLAKKYDIVQSCEYDQIYNIYLQKKIKNKLVIYHGPYYSEFNKGYNFKCKVFDTFFLTKNYKKAKFISKSALATEFLKGKGFEDVTTIGVGLDYEKISKEITNSECETILKNDEKYLLYIGRIEERRNIYFLLNILHEVMKTEKNVKLILIGKGEKEYVEKVWEYAKKMELIDNIIYFEKIKQEDIKAFYTRSNIFILPTNYDIFGMVLLEAMCFGIPTITTLNGGSSTIIKNYENGFICDITNIEQWKNCIIEVLNNSKLSEKISNNAQRTIEQEFLWIKLSEKFIQVYKNAFTKGE